MFFSYVIHFEKNLTSMDLLRMPSFHFLKVTQTEPKSFGLKAYETLINLDSCPCVWNIFPHTFEEIIYLFHSQVMFSQRL